MNPPPLAKIFIITSIVVPIFVYVLVPKGLELYTRKKIVSRTLLIVAGLLFFISWYLPSPLIYGQYTAFTTHFVGGGIFTGFLWLFVRRHLQFHFQPIQELCILYFLISGLGVANELFELGVAQAGLANINGSDTWWDLLANTSGAFTFFLLYKLLSLFKKSTTQSE